MCTANQKAGTIWNWDERVRVVTRTHLWCARYVSFFSGGPGTGNAWGYSYNLGWQRDTWQEMELWHVTRDMGWPEEVFITHELGVNSDISDKWSIEFSCSQLTTISRLWAKTSSVISRPIRGQYWGHVICLDQSEASIERKQSLNHQYIQEWSLFGRFNTFLRLGLFCCCSKFI